MNWKFDFSPDTSDMMGNWSLGECRLVVLVVGGWCRGCRVFIYSVLALGGEEGRENQGVMMICITIRKFLPGHRNGCCRLERCLSIAQQ